MDDTVICTLKPVLILVRKFLVNNLLAITGKKLLMMESINACDSTKWLMNCYKVYINLIPLHNHVLFKLLIPFWGQHFNINNNIFLRQYLNIIKSYVLIKRRERDCCLINISSLWSTHTRCNCKSNTKIYGKYRQWDSTW